MPAHRAVIDEHGFSATFRQRFESKLTRTPNGCLEWTAGTNAAGYGRIGRGPQTGGYITTHRAAWILEHGQIPDGMVICHRCDNPPCCDPDHLFLGTHADNHADAIAKGRAVYLTGEAHPHARLSDQQITDLRALHITVSNYAELGRRFGISKQYARTLILGLRRA